MPLDPRFKHLLRDERFSSTARVDRYGRQLQRSGNDGRNRELERLYRVEDEEESQQENDEAAAVEDESGEDDAVVTRELERAEKAYDPAREGGFTDSSSSEESSDGESEAEAAAEDAAEGHFEYPDRQPEEVPPGEVTARLAVVNLDWDHIRAVDLLAVFSSFVSEGGRILKAAVYPSEFGKERMDREAIEGPPKEIFPVATSKGDDSDERGPEMEDEETSEDEDADDDEKIRKSIVKEDKGEEFNPTLLRRYQLERLRYFYAVLTCSSPACAQAIYRAVDGLEFLATANFLDLRFVPDAMDFSADRPRDECNAIPPRYQPNTFVTDALQHSRVKLTWDADDGKRKEVQTRAFTGNRAEIDDNDLKAYLGSDTSDDDAEPERTVEEAPKESDLMVGTNRKASKKEQERQRMRSLLGLGAEPEPKKARNGEMRPVGDVQITFSAGLSERPGEPEAAKKADTEETTIEKYRRKEKERKHRRREDPKAKDASDQDGSDAASDKDLGFDDPFFEDPEQADRTAKQAERKRKRKRAAAEVAAEEAAAEAAQLKETLQLDDEAGAAAGVGHFDMGAIERGEKAQRRLKKARGRRARASAREKVALDMKRKDAFEMDVHDPRFRAVYERSEFALDPSHPRFKQTEGMGKLVEEGRRKRARETQDVT